MLRVWVTGALLATSLAAGVPVAVGKSSPPPVSVFPIPGDMVATPQTQIAFRGVPASQLGTIQVTGSRSGAHTGQIKPDSDGNGASFVPSTPFIAGETVTVKTSLNIRRAAHYGTYHFTVATPSGDYPQGCSIKAPRVPGDVWSFKSRPDLSPAAVKILHRYGKGGGSADIFLTPQYGPVQNGPEIVDPNGQLVWFDPVPHCDMASEFQVQQYHGQPVLTWWQGYSAQGMGFGQDMIYNTSYQPVATVSAANGLMADLHEFQLTPQGTGLITAFYPVLWRYCNCTVFDSVVQEIDIPTGLVLFQWNSLDHVPLSGSYIPNPHGHGAWDYFHINSIQLDSDGNLLLSGRNTWAAYKVDHQTGVVDWSIGGKWSNFRMERGTSFAFQHDVRSRSSHDNWLTIFDDGGGRPNVHSQSRALELYLSFKNHTAWLGGQWFHSPPLMADFEGNVQQLSKGWTFVGWGQQPYFTEYGVHNRTLLDGRFVSQTASYRAYRFPWSATPAAPPDLVASANGGQMTLNMSWNGATGVASWRVLGGSSAAALRTLTTVPKTSFETSATVAQQAVAEVQALDSNGRVLGTSAAVSVG
jgi:arylsulfotransferase ASST